MRLAAVFMVGFMGSGCVAVADFAALRDEVFLVKVDNRKLKETQEGLRKRLEEQERALKATEVRQQGLEEQIRVLEAQSRRLEALTARSEGAEIKPPAKIPSLEIPGSGQAVKPLPSLPPPPAGSAGLTPTAAYNQAYNDYLQGNYDLAVAGFEAFLNQFPDTSLTAHAQYWIGEAYFNKKEYMNALHAYDRVLADYPTSDKIAAALYKTGATYAELENKAKARDFLKRVIEEYPQSEEANLAKQRLADLR
jgi:tol-pal system protein YbgF